MYKIFKMKKNILLIVIILILIGFFFASIFIRNKEEVKNGAEENEKETEITKSFIECLANAGVVIYGSETCPACASLVNSLGGYEKIESIYVECSQEMERCSSEMQTNYVPEIQIQGKIYTGPRDPGSIAETVSCEI